MGAYLSATIAEFKDWAWAKGFNRQWLLQGGFTPPISLGSTAWWITTFEGLKLGEIKREKQGLCHRSLVIRYKTLEGVKGEVTLQSDWDEELVAEKFVPGTREDQECKQQYTAMC